jgi:hypothetical protein
VGTVRNPRLRIEGYIRSRHRGCVTLTYTVPCMLRTIWAHSSRRFAHKRVIHNLPKSPATSSLSADDAQIHASKRRTRGGQNLGARYQRLEASLREKGALAQSITDSPAPNKDLSSLKEVGDLPKPSPKPATEMYKGFVVPEEPQEPGPEGMLVSLHRLIIH